MIDNKKDLRISDSAQDTNIEKKFLKGINKRIFYKHVNNEGINLANILMNTNRPIREYHKFNLFLRKITKQQGFTLYECIMYMEEEYVKFKKILSMLDQENVYRLKDEMSKKYGIKILRTKLNKFIYKEDEDFENE